MLRDYTDNRYTVKGYTKGGRITWSRRQRAADDERVESQMVQVRPGARLRHPSLLATDSLFSREPLYEVGDQKYGSGRHAA
jgi:hypothetical protein